MRKVCLLSFCSLLLLGITVVKSQTATLLSEGFNGAGIPAGWVKINNSIGGDPAAADWTLRQNGYTYTSGNFDPITFHSNDNTQFYLSNSDAQGSNNITETILQSPAISTMTYSFISLRLYHHFREYQTDTGYVEISTNNTTWTTISKIYADPEDSIGAANSFAQKIVNLNAYSNLSTVYIRFRYYAIFGYYWAIDNVTVLASTSSPLLVSLSNFNGYREGNHNLLKWSTVSEENNKGFQIERSINGINYFPIGYVQSQANSGNSNSKLNYSFIDNSLSGDKQYYRLREIDLNGSEKLSNIILIKGIQLKILKIDAVFPNPVITTLNIFISSSEHHNIILQMIDMNGRLMKQTNATTETGSNTISVDVSSLIKGVYMLKVISSTGETAVSKFIKQ